jgi:hypothetical protein
MRSILHGLLRSLATAAGVIYAFSAAAESVPVPTLGAGTTIETLQVGKTTFSQVRVKAVNARTLTFLHSGGMASVSLRDLSPEWQVRFGYNPAAEASANAALAAAQSKAEEQRQKARAQRSSAKQAAQESSIERLLESFGRSPEITPVDLRPQFLNLGLDVKNQGRRPSCAVFAIVSALEFQNASLTGRAEKFSEEYLIWATRKTLGQSPDPTRTATDAAESDFQDAGFSLSEVVQGLRTYGIVPQDRMSYRKLALSSDEPTEQLVTEARTHRRVFVHDLPGRDEASIVMNLVQALNAGYPVAIGLRWPNELTARSGYLSQQKGLPENAHAVTLVGYENTTGRIEDTVFIFKNSWGITWGVGGYGHATRAYLLENLLHAVVLEVEPGTT